MCDSYAPREGFPPVVITVASGSKRATEWYKCGYAFVPAELKVLPIGSYKSEFSPAVLLSSSLIDPPNARIFPVGRMTALISIRGCDIAGPYTQAGFATERSIS